jgi:hypothetical protein
MALTPEEKAKMDAAADALGQMPVMATDGSTIEDIRKIVAKMPEPRLTPRAKPASDNP